MDDGRIISSEFDYSNATNKTCQTLSLAVQELDVKNGTVFFAYISLPAESSLELGAVDSASITLVGGSDGGKDDGGTDDGGKDDGDTDNASTGQSCSLMSIHDIILEFYTGLFARGEIGFYVILNMNNHVRRALLENT